MALGSFHGFTAAPTWRGALKSTDAVSNCTVDFLVDLFGASGWAGGWVFSLAHLCAPKTPPGSAGGAPSPDFKNCVGFHELSFYHPNQWGMPRNKWKEYKHSGVESSVVWSMVTGILMVGNTHCWRSVVEPLNVWNLTRNSFEMVYLSNKYLF